MKAIFCFIAIFFAVSAFAQETTVKSITKIYHKKINDSVTMDSVVVLEIKPVPHQGGPTYLAPTARYTNPNEITVSSKCDCCCKKRSGLVEFATGAAVGGVMYGVFSDNHPVYYPGSNSYQQGPPTKRKK